MALNKNKLGGALLCLFSAFALIVLMDFCIGNANAWLYHHSKYGIFHRQQYVLNESKDDIIILGSSRASHHYVPSIITDSLGMSCYNAGSEGMCIYYHYAMLASLLERGHCPKLVIYDVMNLDAIATPGPTFTLEATLDRLAPHYGDYKCVDSLFITKGWKEQLKLKSLTYRYNSKLVQSIKCNYIPMPEDNGYEKVNGELSNNTAYMKYEYKNEELDSNKLVYVQKLVDLAKRNHIKLLFTYSPNYYSDPSNAYDAINKIAENNGIEILNCYNDPLFMSPELFRDEMHLNDKGAHLWSSYLAHLLIENNNCK